jgi:hypothetical protein
MGYMRGVRRSAFTAPAGQKCPKINFTLWYWQKAHIILSGLLKIIKNSIIYFMKLVKFDKNLVALWKKGWFYY